MYEFKDKMGVVLTLLDLINKNKDSEPVSYSSGWLFYLNIVVDLISTINSLLPQSMYEFKDKMTGVLTLLEWNNKNKDSEPVSFCSV